MKLGIIVGGWYYPKHLYKELINSTLPSNTSSDYFVVSHRNPSDIDIKSEMLGRVKGDNKYDLELYSSIVTYDELKKLGYTVVEVPNMVGDYFFFNQWTEYYDYTQYDYIVFLHDDNYLLPKFKDIFVDIFENRVQGVRFENDRWVGSSLEGFNYIANSAVGNRRTARGSFSIWSKYFLDSLGGTFPMEGVTLKRDDSKYTPKDHHALADWNKVGHNLQEFVDTNNFTNTSFRLSKHYRVSPYIIEGERGLISKTDVLYNEMKRGYEQYIR